MKKLTLLVLLVVVAGCGILGGKSVEYPDGYEARIDVVYTTVDGWEGRMDLYFDPEADNPAPVVINIHGGGWNHGEKESQTGFGSFFKNGYAVANVEYRLSGKAAAPAAIEDVRCALIYLYEHAEELNINTDKIVVMGTSAGGHLALMAGLLGNDKRFDTNCMYDGEVKVAAIVDKYGPTDLVPARENSSVKKWLAGKYEDIEFTKSISPINYVTEKSAPVFIVHGDKDPLVPYEQSVELFNKLKENGVQTDMYTVEGGVHGKFSAEEKKIISDKIWQFLKEAGLN